METQVFVIVAKGETLLGFTSLHEDYYIDNLYVSHLHLGKGIASQLIDCIEKLSTELKSNVSITALPFLEKLGYKVIKKKEIKHLEEVLVNFDVVKKLVE